MDQYKDVMLEAAENSVKLTQAQDRLDRAEKGRAQEAGDFGMY